MEGNELPPGGEIHGFHRERIAPGATALTWTKATHVTGTEVIERTCECQPVMWELVAFEAGHKLAGQGLLRRFSIIHPLRSAETPVWPMTQARQIWQELLRGAAH